MISLGVANTTERHTILLLLKQHNVAYNTSNVQYYSKDTSFVSVHVCTTLSTRIVNPVYSTSHYIDLTTGLTKLYSVIERFKMARWHEIT